MFDLPVTVYTKERWFLPRKLVLDDDIVSLIYGVVSSIIDINQRKPYNMLSLNPFLSHVQRQKYIIECKKLHEIKDTMLVVLMELI